jgi:hypothetical protein
MSKETAGMARRLNKIGEKKFGRREDEPATPDFSC